MWDVPLALWAYALFRSLAFAAPSWSDGGQIGLGVVVVIGVYAFVLKRSGRAWSVLVGIDSLSLALIAVTWLDGHQPPFAVPVLALASLLLLLLPSTRGYVGAKPGRG